MLIVMKRGYTEEELQEVVREIEKVGYRPHVSRGVETTLVGAIGRGPTPELMEHFRALPGVAEVIPISKPWKLASLEVQPFPTVLEFPTGKTGGGHVMVAAGPCGVESREQTLRAAHYVKAHGAHMPRGGAFKPRTSPYAFQGHGKACLPWVFELAGKYGIKVIAMEVTHESHIEEIKEALHQTGNPTGVMLQIGTRNTQNFELLKIVGRQQEFPVLFKRGFGITLGNSL